MSEPVSVAEEESARVDTLSEGLESESLNAVDFDAPEIGADDESLQEDYSEDEPFGGDFISPSTRFALDQAFEQIETVPKPAPVAPSSEASVEAVFARAVQEAFDPTLQDWVDNHGEDIVSRLTPLIREWMDKNLPSLVEAAVTKEISRAVRSRRR
jgi:cell pole-organizing protein PopZ